MGNKVKIQELAMQRTEAIERCHSLGKKFMEHFNKTLDAGGAKDPDLIHHVDVEMAGWLEQVSKIKLSSTKKPITMGQIKDWFLYNDDTWTRKDIIKPEYRSAYKHFVDSIIKGNHREKLSALLIKAIVDTEKDDQVKIQESEQHLGDVIDICMHLGTQFVFDFNVAMEKYKARDTETLLKVIEALSDTMKQVRQLTNERGKKLNAEELIDYFFTAGMNLTDMVTEEYEEIYSDFAIGLMANMDTYEAFMRAVSL